MTANTNNKKAVARATCVIDIKANQSNDVHPFNAMNDEVPLLRDSKDNDTIIYDLPRLEEKGNRSDDVFPELPFPTPPAPSLKKQQDKRQI